MSHDQDNPFAPPGPATLTAPPPPPAPAGPPPADPGAGTPAGPTPPRRERRTPWLGIGGTAVASALVASLLTAGLTGAFDDDAPAATPAPVTQQVTGTSGSASTASPDWEAVAAAVRPSVVAIEVRTPRGSGQGSGVVIDDEGHVLTNHHVVGGAPDGAVRVTLADGRVVAATVVGTDPTTDLAVIRLETTDDVRPATLGDSSDVVVGQPVMAVGNPLGLASTVTTGIVSAVDRPVTTSGGDATVVTNAIQVDAAINPGNSGGPLFDADGHVIGINSSIASMPNAMGGSSGSIGLGFAIPSSLAQRVAADLVADGVAEHAFLGVTMSQGTATADGVTRRAAVVEQVTPGSPADGAGLRPGDAVVAIDGKAVDGPEALTGFVRAAAPGDEVGLRVVRDGEATDLAVTLAVRPERPTG